MLMAANVSLVDSLATLTAKLDSLSADQAPGDLSNALRSAFTQRELYDTYLSSVVEDKARVKVLLEVFDKVRTETNCRSV